MKKFLLGILVGLIAGRSDGRGPRVFAAIRFADRKPALPAQGSAGVCGSRPDSGGCADGTCPSRASRTARRSPWPESVERCECRRADSAHQAVCFEPRGLGAGWGKLDEIRAGLEAVRKGRQARLRLSGRRPARANTTWRRPPTGFSSPPKICSTSRACASRRCYFKGTLDKLGVEVEVEHVGRYKDAGDIVSRARP